MTDPKVTLHDVSVEGTADHDGVLEAIQRAVAAASSDGPTPSARTLKAGISNDVPHAIRGGDR